MDPRAKRAYIADLAEGGRRAARSMTCPRCGAPIVRGEDDDVMAAVVSVDAEPLTPAKEFIAILDGLVTYDLSKRTGKTARPGAMELNHRYRERADRPPRGTCHAQHICKGPR